ncbi:hypothetical protein I4U23_030198 [Adineta vaga]|nr:hypothetical protein I4U23_030198 [Adineta vaga]
MDRNRAQSTTQKMNSRLKAVVTSPYVRNQLQHAGLINNRGQVVSHNPSFQALSSRRYHQEEDQIVTPEILFRALKNDENNRLSRYHQFQIASRRTTFNSFELLDRRHRKQLFGSEKSRQKSAPAYTRKTDYKDERRSRVTSVRNKKPRSDKDLLEYDSEQVITNQQSQLDIYPEECRTCEITMSYKSKHAVHNPRNIRSEVVVVQQRSTENLVVYRGFLAEGESFSFQTQRRSTSLLALTFYTRGLIESVVKDCCEYHYDRKHRHTNERNSFIVEQIRNASPCEKCRNKYSQRTLSPHADNTAPNTRADTHSYQIHRPTTNSHEDISSDKQSLDSKGNHRYKKNTQPRKQSSVTTNPINDYEKRGTQIERCKSVNTDRSQSVDFRLLELALNDDTKLSTRQTPTDSIRSSISDDNTITRNTESIQERTSLTCSEQSQNVQDWVNQTDSSSLNTHKSMDSNSSANVENPHAKFTSNPPEEVRSLSQLSLDFIYILDGTIEMSDNDKIRLRGLINSGLIINDINDKVCIEYVTDTIQEQIIMILSKTNLENLQKYIHDLSQVRYIYVVDHNNEESYDSIKIQGIYTSLSRVCHRLEKDLISLTSDFMMILSISANDTSNNSFVYLQILKDIILENDEQTDLQKEMLDFCRQQYAENEIQLKFINEFERYFRPEEAVKWYIRQEIFLFKMLTRAFRLPDPYILYKLRFFVQHLQRQLKLNNSSIPITVYRTQYVSKTMFDSFSKNKGGYITFNSFLLTQRTKVTSQQQKTELSCINLDVIFVLFQMEIEVPILMMEIEPNTDELLLSAASVFQISNIKGKDKNMPIIKLSINNDTLNIVQQINKNFQEIIHQSFPLLRIAKLMKQMKDFPNIEYFCNILINHPLTEQDQTANLIVAGLFHMLCCYYYEQKQYDRALKQLQKSLQIYLRVLPSDDIKLTPTYNNMGSIYHKQELDAKALYFHRKAYDIQILSSSPDLDSIAAYAGNIASVLIKQGKYEEAIPYLQRDLQIQQRLYPYEDDLELSTKYHNLAGAQSHINQYSKALENYQKCLAIELKLHVEDHPTIAVTYYNMSTVLEGLGRLNEAIETMDKAIQRLLLTRDENHDEIRFYKDYRKHLQEKV